MHVCTNRIELNEVDADSGKAAHIESSHCSSMNVGVPSNDNDFLSVCMPTKPCAYHSCQKLNVSEHTAHDTPELAYERG